MTARTEANRKGEFDRAADEAVPSRKHAPEPWSLMHSNAVRAQGVIDGDMHDIAVCCGNAAKSWPNAARIVACVNACEGLSEKEISALGNLAEFFDKAANEHTRLREANTEVGGGAETLHRS